MIKLVLMHKFILLISIMFFSYNSNATEGSFYDFDIKSISGEKINLSEFKDIIFTSSNAVRFLNLNGLDKNIKCFCVGNATEKEARAQGDLSENADYDAARTEQARIEARISEIENILKFSKIIKNNFSIKL